MKHEKFKTYSVGSKELVEFLNSNVTPKSISLSKGIVIIGYVDSKKEHNYKLVTENITPKQGDVLAERIENAAAAHSGVICLDVNITDNNLELTFLIADELC